MPDVLGNDELNALAAEYVLGTLDYEERKGAAALLEVDAAFRGIVRIWERRFGDLHLMVEAVDPNPQLWQRIKPKMEGVEQIALAIPSHADEPPSAVAATPTIQAPATVAPTIEAPATVAPTTEALATEAPTTEAPPTVPAADAAPAEPRADASAAEGLSSPVVETPSIDTKPADSKPFDYKPFEYKPFDYKPVDSKPADSKPAETPPAIAEAELKLAELAALLPVGGEQGGAAQGAAQTAAPAEPTPDEGLHTHAPDLVPRGFVPPVPMSTRGTPAVVEVPVGRKGGRGWMAATMIMAGIAVALAGLISAWRFFPERLPAQLRANAVLNPTSQAQPAPKAMGRSQLAPFDE